MLVRLFKRLNGTACEEALAFQQRYIRELERSNDLKNEIIDNLTKGDLIEGDGTDGS